VRWPARERGREGLRCAGPTVDFVCAFLEGLRRDILRGDPNFPIVVVAFAILFVGIRSTQVRIKKYLVEREKRAKCLTRVSMQRERALNREKAAIERRIGTLKQTTSARIVINSARIIQSHLQAIRLAKLLDPVEMSELESKLSIEVAEAANDRVCFIAQYLIKRLSDGTMSRSVALSNLRVLESGVSDFVLNADIARLSIAESENQMRRGKANKQASR